MDSEVTFIPNDGLEHRCWCGAGPYSVTDHDGWSVPMVTGDEGRTVDECDRCGAVLEVLL